MLFRSTVGLAGYLLLPFKTWERVLMIIAGVCTCIPETVSDVAGIAIALAIIVEQIVRRGRENRSGKTGAAPGDGAEAVSGQ